MQPYVPYKHIFISQYLHYKHVKTLTNIQQISIVALKHFIPQNILKPGQTEKSKMPKIFVHYFHHSLNEYPLYSAKSLSTPLTITPIRDSSPNSELQTCSIMTGELH